MMSSKVWTDSVIDTQDFWHRLTEDQRQDLTRRLDAWGVPRTGRVRTEYALIDCPMVAVTRVLKTAEGHSYLDPGTDEVAKVTEDYAVRDRLPEWWQPA